MTFLALLFAHLLGDYPLQGPFLSTEKGKNLILLYTHAAIWTGTILVAVHLLGFNVTVLDVYLLFAVHAIADYCKSEPMGVYKKLDPLRGGLLLDQSIHVAQILVLMLYKGMF